MSHQSLTIQASSLAEAEEMNLVPRPSEVLPQQVLTGPVGISSTSESPVMTVIEANGKFRYFCNERIYMKLFESGYLLK